MAGSSSRGGAQASQELLSAVQNGQDICITPDGPRGPVRKSKAGVVRIAQRAGLPILPTSYAVSRFWQVKSWDRMVIPKPFSRGVFYVGEELVVKDDVDQACQDLDQALDEADRAANACLQSEASCTVS